MELNVNGVIYVPKEDLNEKKFVLIRTYTAGVHCGYLNKKEGMQVVLNNARRIWRWKGANSLNELSQNGGDIGYTRISELVPEIVLEANEIITCSKKAKENLEQSRWPA